MLSHKLKCLEQFLQLAASGMISPPPAALKAAARQATDCRNQAEQLELRVIPRRQRLEDHHLKDGKVTLLPIIPRDQAVT